MANMCSLLDKVQAHVYLRRPDSTTDATGACDAVNGTVYVYVPVMFWKAVYRSTTVRDNRKQPDNIITIFFKVNIHYNDWR